MAWFFHDRGAAHFQLGESQPAIDDFTQAILLNPNFEWAYRNRAAAWDTVGQPGCAQADREIAEKLRQGQPTAS
jgi:tetratricopeptide (TPR) repeat protein